MHACRAMLSRVQLAAANTLSRSNLQGLLASHPCCGLQARRMPHQRFDIIGQQYAEAPQKESVG